MGEAMGVGLFVWTAEGAIVGVLAWLLMPNDEPAGLPARICIGIGGAVVGAWIALRGVGIYGITTYDWQAMVGAGVGAIVLVVLHRGITWRQQRRRRPVIEPAEQRRLAA